MRVPQRYVAFIALLILLGSGCHFFGLLIPGLRPGLVARNLGGGYGYGNDLYPIWMGSRELLFHGHDPYTRELTARIETGLYGRPLDRSTPSDSRVNYRAYSYPLYTIFLLAPLAPLAFPAVQAVLSILLPGLVAISVVLWLRVLGTNLSPPARFTTICLTLASYPVLEGVYAGQPGLMSAALIAGVAAALAGERFVLAGVLLACASIKPQLILLVALWLILWAVSDWRRRRSFLLSFAATTTLLLAASTWVLPSWFTGWTQALGEYRLISPPPLAQFVLGRVAGMVLSVFLLALSTRLCWRERRQPAASTAFALATSFVLATTVLVLPSAIAIYDQVLLLPAALWLYTRRDRILGASLPVRLLALCAVGALAWQWFSAGALVLARLVSPAVAHMPNFLSVPLRTAASVPFAFVALLALVAVQEMKPVSTIAERQRTSA